MSHPFKVGSKAVVVGTTFEAEFPIGASVTAIEVEGSEYDGRQSALWENGDGNRSWLPDSDVRLITEHSDFDLLEMFKGRSCKFRSGCPVRFVAYVPDAKPHCRLVFLSANGNVFYRYENGKTSDEDINDPGDVLVA